ncbi:hypothetical protein Tco_1390899, partial [Tanacetum coccineum]
MNQNHFEHNSNYSGFDQPPQYSIDHQPPIINQEWISKLNKEIIENLRPMFEEFRERQQAANIDQSPPREMSLKEMEDLKQHYLDEMKSLSNDLQIKDYRNEKIDIRFRRECEDMIAELKSKFNGMSIEINKKKELQYLEQVAKLSTYTTEPSRHFNCTCCDDDDYEESTIPLNEIDSQTPLSIKITPVLPTLKPDNSLSMGDEHLSTIPETESDEVIKSSVENLVPIPSEFEGIFDDTCDVTFCDNSPPLDVLNDHFKIFFDFKDDYTSSDEDFYEDIDYVEASPPDLELVSLGEVKDDILCEKLFNINLLIAKIESLNDNHTPDCVLKSPSLFPIPIEDSDSFFENDHTEETRSGSTTTHADNSLTEYDSFHFEIEPDQ